MSSIHSSVNPEPFDKINILLNFIYRIEKYLRMIYQS